MPIILSYPNTEPPLSLSLNILFKSPGSLRLIMRGLLRAQARFMLRHLGVQKIFNFLLSVARR
jgi:hypothetical protein